MNKVILYYKFVPVEDPESVMHWQRLLCETNELRGRIIVSTHGINGTLGGDVDGLKAYIKAMNLHSKFKRTEYKWSAGTGKDFPKLSVKVRDELVTLAPDEEFNVFDSGKALRPAQWKRLLEENPEITILDARNEYESDIGRFKGSITPPIRAFREIKETLDQLDKDDPIATYCTGDIRCEYLSAYMKHRGFKQVYHLDGGIVKYGQQFGEDGVWEGKCYVFDKRMNVGFGPSPTDIASCSFCDAKTSSQVDCRNEDCQRQFVVCESCQAGDQLVCAQCREF